MRGRGKMKTYTSWHDSLAEWAALLALSVMLPAFSCKTILCNISKLREAGYMHDSYFLKIMRKNKCR